MVDRRAFLKFGAGLAATLAGVSRAASAPPSGRPPTATPDVVLVDRHLAGSGPLVATAHARGVAPLEFSGDAGSAWMRELEPRLRLGPTTIEAYTSAATLFCLELLARDYGARVVRRRDAADGVAWILSSSPPRRAALAPLPKPRSPLHA